MSRLLFRTLSLFICFLAFLLETQTGFAGERIALVIGNGAYQRVPALPNPPRDSADIARALERLSFQVTRLDNANAAEMRKSLVEFGRKADGSDVALVFYAGHGMEVGGENWLIPVDAELQTDTDIESEAVSLRSVNLQVAKARQLGLIILDACRNNPFAGKMKRSLATRAVDRGLARTEPTDNVLVAYAARDGTTASDGTGRNSPFTSALLRHIETPGLEISFLFRRVRDDVLAATNREQQPFVYGSLSKDEIYLKPSLAPAPEKVAAAAKSGEDEQFWEAIKTSDVAGLFEEFLRRYPRSSRASEARQRLASLSSPQQNVAKSEAADPARPSQTGSDSRRGLSREDETQIAALATELKLKLPSFAVGEIKSDVPQSIRRFVGVWANIKGYGGGGRPIMLILTEATASGTVGGYYVWGAATKSSWVKDEAGSSLISGQITDGALVVRVGKLTMTARLDGLHSMTARIRMQVEGEEKTATGRFKSIWLLEQGKAAEASHNAPSARKDAGTVPKTDLKSRSQEQGGGGGSTVTSSAQTLCDQGGCRQIPKGCHLVSGNPAKPWTSGSSNQSVVCN